MEPAAAETTDFTGGRLLHLAGWPPTAEWELSVAELKQYTSASKLRSVSLELPMPDPAGPATISLRMETYMHNGSVSVFMCLPPGTKARWAHCIGPNRKTPRVLTDIWDKADRFYGTHDYGRLDDHVADGVVKLSVALLVCTQATGLRPCPVSLEMGKQLGEGSFGLVRQAFDSASGRQDIVVKQSSRGEKSNFDTEAMVLQRLADCPGFPELIGHFTAPKDVGQEILVMASLHRTLENLRCDPNVGPPSRLSPTTIVSIGVQLIDRLQTMHERDFVHMDIKPDNIMIGPGHGNVLYLIDFGLCRHWRVNGAHVPAKRSMLRGTARYCSVHAHQGLQSRRADLEALAYVLIYLAVGALPWQGCGTKGTKKDRYDNTLETKLEPDVLEDFTKERLPDALPLAHALCDMARRCLLLEFEEEPAYDLLRSSLESSIGAPTFSGNKAQAFDWIADDGSLIADAGFSGQKAEGGHVAQQGSVNFNSSAAATRGRMVTSAADRSDPATADHGDRGTRGQSVGSLASVGRARSLSRGCEGRGRSASGGRASDVQPRSSSQASNGSRGPDGTPSAKNREALKGQEKQSKFKQWRSSSAGPERNATPGGGSGLQASNSQATAGSAHFNSADARPASGEADQFGSQTAPGSVRKRDRWQACVAGPSGGGDDAPAGCNVM